MFIELFRWLNHNNDPLYEVEVVLQRTEKPRAEKIFGSTTSLLLMVGIFKQLHQKNFGRFKFKEEGLADMFFL